MPSPRKGESQNDFISRCMSSDESQNSFPNQKQRSAFCHSQWTNKGKSSKNMFVYKDPITRELHYYDRRGVFKKNGRTLVFVKELKGETMSEPINDLIQEADRLLQENKADKDAGYPPNCKPGYVEKDGKCVPEKKD
jgi:hypothetical protein